jgi:single-stranded DNA-binding protein
MKLNRHQIAGRIVEDPEYGSIPGSGIPTIKLRVVTDDGWYDTKKQEYQKNNQYHTVKQVNKAVDKMNFQRDDWVFVEGSSRTDMWEDRDGNKKYSTYIRATIIVEIPDPWENKDSGGGRSSRDDRGSSQRNDGRNDRRDSRRDDRGRGRDRDSRRDGRDRDRDRDRGRDSGRRDMPTPDDDIPF